MRAGQCKVRLVVVEYPGIPLGNGVAALALFLRAAGYKLAAVYVFMATGARNRGACEDGNRFRFRGLSGGGPVATDALHRLMRAFQRELRRAVIVGPQLFPLADVMAGVAGFFGLPQFGPMRIAVAGGAGLFREMVLPGRLGIHLGIHVNQRLVAIGTNHGRMGSGERELRLGMARLIECGRLENALRMALLTLVDVGVALEFAAMRIFVAAHAGERTEHIFGVAPLRGVALGAFHRLMFALQREGALPMLLAREERGFEVDFIVAGGTIAAGRAMRKLPFMDIFVAILTALMRYRLTEVGAFVALAASDPAMFAMERKLGLLVIEAGIAANRFPTRIAVAALASAPKRRLLKRALVRIGMATLATCKTKTAIARKGLARRRRVAFLTRKRLMRSG